MPFRTNREIIGPTRAEILALEVLGWLAEKPETLERFLLRSGLAVDDLRAMAGSRDLAAAVLSFLLADEALLVDFCQTTGTRADALHRAQHLLEGRDDRN